MSKEYPKKKCEICGEEISTHHLAWGNHQKKHKREPVKIADVSVGEDEKKFIKDKNLRKLYEKAELAQDRFREAPEAVIAEGHEDERQKLVRAYAPDCLEPNSEFVPAFGDAREMSQDVAKGLKPVIDKRGDLVNHRGDPLYRVLRKQREARLKASGAESAARLPKETEDMKALKQSHGGLVEEEIKLEKGKINEI